MKYHVSIGEERFEVVVDGDDVSVNGRAVRAHLEAVPGSPEHTLVIDGHVHRLLARPGVSKGLYDLSLGGYRFQAEALDARARAIRELSGAAGRPAGPTHVLAPMPGLIIRINVAAGDAVQPGQGLVVMEAMKMENELRAIAAGTVKRVAVSPGSAVEKGALILEIE